MNRKIFCISGMPRSGTSWLGEIIDSSPSVRYFFQPLFSYAFKGRLNHQTSADEFRHFFSDLSLSEDDFLHQSEKRVSGLFPTFEKDNEPPHIAFKTCRYQYLLPKMLQRLPEFYLVGIVRHPCGALNSWLNNPKEFPQGLDPRMEWRFGACRNQGREEEFFGYYKWKEVAHLYLDLQQKFPKNTFVIRYEDLALRTHETVLKLFSDLSLELTAQTSNFLEACHARHDESPYSVFKSRDVVTAWKNQLLDEIQDEVIGDLTGTRLEQFCR